MAPSRYSGRGTYMTTELDTFYKMVDDIVIA
jgi:hypothetical protein